MARQSGAEGRWSLINYGSVDVSLRETESFSRSEKATLTQRQTAVTEQLLRRYGILVRSATTRELVEGGFAALYPILRAMEEAGRVRRGYFVAGMGGAQFALPGTDELLRRAPEARDGKSRSEVTILAASDPANAYGTLLKWPITAVENFQPQRTAGARVFMLDGRLLAYLGRTGNHLLTFSAEDPADQPHADEQLAAALAKLADATGALVNQINGRPAAESALAPILARHAFTPTTRGLLHRPREAPTSFIPSPIN
jgi:ATP-dependent Lhr-like helicase